MDLKYFTQPTPNPNAVKFILNVDVITKGESILLKAEDCHNNELGHLFLRLKCIVQVHFFENVITITQNGDMYWEELEDAVISILQDGIDKHNPEFQVG